ncbi:MAG: tetratricopeptide repeat protein [Firmicutes bacterium]|nr:tetratricopeptide repeat protein [Bacillota bacterium]
MARCMSARATRAAKQGLVIVAVFMLALSFSIEAADVPFSDVPYGIQASSDLEAGVALFQSGRVDHAIRAFSREIERDPEGPDAAEVYAWLGYAYFCKGWSSEALKAYEESFAGTTDPDLQVQALLALGQLYLDNGNYDKALSTFHDALRLSSGKEQIIAKNLIAIANYEAGNVSAAKEMFEEVLSESSQDPVADYYIQVIEYAEKKKRVLFPTKPQFGKGYEAAAKGTVTVNSGAKYTMTPHVKLSLGVEADSAMEGFFLSSGDDSFRWHSWQSPNIPWRLTGEEDGVKQVNVVYYAKGLSGVRIAGTSITLDRKPPWGSFTINEGEKYTNNTSVRLNFSFYDTLSGIGGICLSNDGISWTDWMQYRSSIHWLLPPGDGKKTVYAHVHDGAGNISGVITASVELDTTPPALWFINLKHLSPTSVEITWMTDESSDSAVEFRLDSDRRQSITVRDDKFTTHHVIRLEDLKPETKYRFKVLSCDLAGNLSVSGEYSFVTKAENQK